MKETQLHSLRVPLGGFPTDALSSVPQHGLGVGLLAPLELAAAIHSLWSSNSCQTKAAMLISSLCTFSIPNGRPHTMFRNVFFNWLTKFWRLLLIPWYILITLSPGVHNFAYCKSNQADPDSSLRVGLLYIFQFFFLPSFLGSFLPFPFLPLCFSPFFSSSLPPSLSLSLSSVSYSYFFFPPTLAHSLPSFLLLSFLSVSLMQNSYTYTENSKCSLPLSHSHINEKVASD